MVVKQTFSLYLRLDLLEELKKRKINISALVNTLLEQYLHGETEISKAYLEIQEIKKELAEIKNHVSRLEELEKKIAVIEKEIEIEEEIDVGEYIEVVKDLFKDFEEMKIRHDDKQIKQFYEKRLQGLAIDFKKSISEMKKIVLKIKPELENYL